jgi:hypothetical protein
MISHKSRVSRGSISLFSFIIPQFTQLFWFHIILFPRFFSRALRFREWAITSVAFSAPLRFEKPKSSMAPIKAGEQSKKMHSKVVSVSI